MRNVKLLGSWAIALMGTILLSVSCGTGNETRFTMMGARSTGIHFGNHIQETDSFNIIDYLYFYNGGGIAAGDIDNDGLVDLYFTSNQGSERLYLNHGGLDFEDITETAGVAGEQGTHKWTTSATMVDINADGLLDIYVSEVNGHGPLRGKNRLYINKGDRTFDEKASEYGLDLATFSQQAVFFDADKDGDLDLFLLNHAVHTPDSYKRAGIRNTRDPMAGDRFFRNEDGTFLDVTEVSGIYSGPMGYGLSVSVADVNNDTWPDIYVGNDFHENDYLYYNKGNGTFEEAIAQSTKYNSTFTMGTDIADVNNDGWMDIFTLDMRPEDEIVFKRSAGVDAYDIYNYKLDFGYHHQYSRNMLQLNRGRLLDTSKVVFSEIAQLKGLEATDWSWGIIFGDFDNNGQQDLYITNGIPRRPNDLDFTNYTANEIERDSLSPMEGLQRMPEGSATNYAFAQEHGQFTNRALQWGLGQRGFSNGAIAADLDNDGDLDIVTNNLNEKATVYRNNTSERDSVHFLTVVLKGNPGNRWGIGTRLYTYSNGKQQLRENGPSSGWLSTKHVNSLHFGWGNETRLDSLKVVWADGRTQTLTHVGMDRTLELSWAEARQAMPKSWSKRPGILTDVTAFSGVDFEHREDGFTNFNTEKMIPHTLSTEGPKMAVADVNGDGLDDFYIGGAKGQSGALYVQQRKGTIFSKREVPIFEKHWVHEDTAATFFDADNDGDLDLYVVSGGSQVFQGEVLRDRLYTNNGKGMFSYHEEFQLPNTEFNGSCAVPFDINGDGLMDLFVGNRAYPTKYGLPGASKFFLNRGNGRFVDASISMLDDRGSIGMVTDAVWNNHRKELVIVGEWMPVTIYGFEGGSITRQRLEHSSGWWNTVELGDLDGDGESEVLLGNVGLNTNLTASMERPMDLYVYDFDGNLSTDPVISFYNNGQRWPYAGLDQLAGQIINVKRTYRTYERFANSTFSEVFPDAQLEKAYHSQVQTLASSYLVKRDGSYQILALPESVQYSTGEGFVAEDFDRDGRMDLLTVGNFYGNHPMMGRSGGSYGSCHSYDKERGFIEIDSGISGFIVDGESRDVQLLRGPNGTKYVLVSRNNDGPKLFAYGMQ